MQIRERHVHIKALVLIVLITIYVIGGSRIASVWLLAPPVHPVNAHARLLPRVQLASRNKAVNGATIMEEVVL